MYYFILLSNNIFIIRYYLLFSLGHAYEQPDGHVSVPAQRVHEPGDREPGLGQRVLQQRVRRPPLQVARLFRSPPSRRRISILLLAPSQCIQLNRSATHFILQLRS